MGVVHGGAVSPGRARGHLQGVVPETQAVHPGRELPLLDPGADQAGRVLGLDERPARRGTTHGGGECDCTV